MNLSGQSVVVATKEQISCNLEGEAAILNLDSGIYYGLDLIGAQVWKLLQQPRRVEEICDAVLREYEVEPSQCQSDLLSLLQQLLAEGLIEVRDGPRV